jgi:hypothetical protein
VFDPQAKIDRQDTLLLVDCHKESNDKKWRSLLIDRHRGVIGSSKETKRLLNEWLEQQTLGLIWQRSMQKVLTKKKRVESMVIVQGNSMFVPVSGATQYSTSWVAVHNLISQVYFSPTKSSIWLNFQKNNLEVLTLEIQANCNFFQKQYRIGQKIMLQQWRNWHSFEAEFKVKENSLLFQNCLADVQELNYVHPRELFNFYQHEMLECSLKCWWEEHVSPEQVDKVYKEVKHRFDTF